MVENTACFNICIKSVTMLLYQVLQTGSPNATHLPFILILMCQFINVQIKKDCCRVEVTLTTKQIADV